MFSQARELSKAGKKLLRINRDLLQTRQAEEIAGACGQLDESVAARDAQTLPGRFESLEKVLNKNFPRPKNAGLRENVEVLLVAVIVAMAVRTFFIQPFKIPTGSMQPTLYGIHEDADCDRNASVLKRIYEVIVHGKSYQNGRCIARGDHIFVDKISYHFRKPHRGEVIVFETGEITDIPAASRGKFYIKRLIGVEHDVIQLKPPYVLVNGEILDSRKAFQRIYSKQDGYNGYVIPETFPPPKFIRSTLDRYEVPAKHLFVLGDNSTSSLDGRFWGSLPDRALVGRAVMVYWPISRRFGTID